MVNVGKYTIHGCYGIDISPHWKNDWLTAHIVGNLLLVQGSTWHRTRWSRLDAPPAQDHPISPPTSSPRRVLGCPGKDVLVKRWGNHGIFTTNLNWFSRRISAINSTTPLYNPYIDHLFLYNPLYSLLQSSFNWVGFFIPLPTNQPGPAN